MLIVMQGDDENLFRKQAIEALAMRPFGRPIGAMPRAWWALLLLLVAVTTAAAWLVVTAEYSRKERVRGWLVSNERPVRVTYAGSATVTEIVKAPGDAVSEGDDLILLSHEVRLAAGGGSVEQVLDSIREELAELEQQKTLINRHAAIDVAATATSLRTMKDERSSLLSQLDDQQSRVSLGREKLRRLEAASRTGAVTGWEVLRQRDELVALEQEARRVSRELSRLERTIGTSESRLSSIPLQTQQALSQLGSRQSELKQQKIRQDARRLTVLKSPIDGKLASVEVHAGNTVAPQQLLATILPAGYALQAEVYVPSRAVGFVEPGQSVRLMYDAFPHYQFGAFPGWVDYVSDFVLLPGEIPATFDVREAVYKMSIDIDEQHVTTAVGDMSLRPGMLLAAEIVLEDRSFLDWLLQPIRRRRPTVQAFTG